MGVAWISTPSAIARGQYWSELITSPWLVVPSPTQMGRLMLSLMKRTDASAMATLTPPEWNDPAATKVSEYPKLTPPAFMHDFEFGGMIS